MNGEKHDGKKWLTELDASPRHGGMKRDGEKIRMDLLPFDALEEIAKVLTFGARKYADDNWKKVDNADTRYRAAMLRHFCAAQKGEKYDAESGLLHAAHTATNALFILWFELQKEKTSGIPK